MGLEVFSAYLGVLCVDMSENAESAEFSLGHHLNPCFLTGLLKRLGP